MVAKSGMLNILHIQHLKLNIVLFDLERSTIQDKSSCSLTNPNSYAVPQIFFKKINIAQCTACIELFPLKNYVTASFVENSAFISHQSLTPISRNLECVV